MARRSGLVLRDVRAIVWGCWELPELRLREDDASACMISTNGSKCINSARLEGYIQHEQGEGVETAVLVPVSA